MSEEIPLWVTKVLSYGYLSRPELSRVDSWPQEIDRHDVPLDESSTKDVWKLLCELSGRDVELKPEAIAATVEKERVFVAEDWRGHVVGMVTLCIHESMHGRYATIHNVIVTASHQRQGIARTLMTIAHRVAKAENVVRMQLTSRAHRADAHQFYVNLGYERVDTHVYRMPLR
ncbi:GNAT family N-acetyltransferase [Patescibacteria group bacterium]|nr:MAG: GNAT family N-acetyltransferase [Patescibacteria group bacterium]